MKHYRTGKDFIEELADAYIKVLRVQCYSSSYYSNESEGDLGSWDDWKQALIDFGYLVHRSQHHCNLSNTPNQPPIETEK